MHYGGTLNKPRVMSLNRMKPSCRPRLKFAENMPAPRARSQRSGRRRKRVRLETLGTLNLTALNLRSRTKGQATAPPDSHDRDMRREERPSRLQRLH
jgi:hypothetical protein